MAIEEFDGLRYVLTGKAEAEVVRGPLSRIRMKCDDAMANDGDIPQVYRLASEILEIANEG